jgi:hypothetical protein
MQLEKGDMSRLRILSQRLFDRSNFYPYGPGYILYDARDAKDDEELYFMLLRLFPELLKENA